MYRKVFLGFLSVGLALTGALSPSIAQGANFKPLQSIVGGGDCMSWTLRISKVKIEALYNETDEPSE